MGRAQVWVSSTIRVRGTARRKHRGGSFRLNKIDTNDLIGIIVVNASVALDLAVETGLGIRPE